jgi:hypothetical protein
MEAAYTPCTFRDSVPVGGRRKMNGKQHHEPDSLQKRGACCTLTDSRQPPGNKAWKLYPISHNFPRDFEKILAFFGFSSVATLRKTLVL